VSFEVLQKKVGSHTARARKFAEYMRHVAAENHLPGYAMTLEDDQAVFWRREEGAGAAYRPPPVISADRRIMVSSQAIERLYDIAPSWDKYMLENLYHLAWDNDKEAARNEDARFLSWVGSYTKGKPAP